MNLKTRQKKKQQKKEEEKKNLSKEQQKRLELKEQKKKLKQSQPRFKMVNKVFGNMSKNEKARYLHSMLQTQKSCSLCLSACHCKIRPYQCI